MKPGSKNNVYGNLLIQMDDEIPRAIAVDSCSGYVTNARFIIHQNKLNNVIIDSDLQIAGMFIGPTLT